MEKKKEMAFRVGLVVGGDSKLIGEEAAGTRRHGGAGPTQGGSVGRGGGAGASQSQRR